MKCLNLGILQSYLDEELTREEKKKVMQHLEKCSTCRQYVTDLQELEAFGEAELGDSDVEVDVDAAWANFEHKLSHTSPNPTNAIEPSYNEENKSTKRKGWKAMKQTTKRWIMSGTIAATLFGSLAIPQVQVAADQFLSIFRVSEVEMVKITSTDLEEIERNLRHSENGIYNLDGVGEIRVTDSGKDYQQFKSNEEAKQAGYDLKELPGYELRYVNVSPSYTLTFTLDVEKANKMLSQIGETAQFDQQLDNKPFSLQVEKTFMVDYFNENGESFTYNKMKMPEITVPKDVSILELKDTMLALPFIPENIRRQLNSIENIEKTLPVPFIQQEGTDSQEINIGGVEGIAITSKHRSYVVWQQDGYVYYLEGNESNLERLKQIATNFIK